MRTEGVQINILCCQGKQESEIPLPMPEKSSIALMPAKESMVYIPFRSRLQCTQQRCGTTSILGSVNGGRTRSNASHFLFPSLQFCQMCCCRCFVFLTLRQMQMSENCNKLGLEALRLSTLNKARPTYSRYSAFWMVPLSSLTEQLLSQISGRWRESKRWPLQTSLKNFRRSSEQIWLVC